MTKKKVKTGANSKTLDDLIKPEKAKKSSETNVYTLVKNAFKRNFNSDLYQLTRHEDSFSLGIPDFSFCLYGINGWIECKYSERWPKKFRSKLSEEQALFLRQNYTLTGHSFVLHQLGTYYLLYRASLVYAIEDTDKEDLFMATKGAAWVVWKRSIKWSEFFHFITDKTR